MLGLDGFKERDVKYENGKVQLICEKDRQVCMGNLKLLVKQISQQSQIKVARKNKTKFSEKFILPEIVNADARKDPTYM